MTQLTLVFLETGTAVLEEDDDQVWASDDDEDFQDEFGNDLLDEEDAAKVLLYLVKAEYLTEKESQLTAIEIQEEAPDDDEPEIIDADFEDVTNSKKH